MFHFTALQALAEIAISRSQENIANKMKKKQLKRINQMKKNKKREHSIILDIKNLVRISDNREKEIERLSIIEGVQSRKIIEQHKELLNERSKPNGWIYAFSSAALTVLVLVIILVKISSYYDGDHEDGPPHQPNVSEIQSGSSRTLNPPSIEVSRDPQP